MGGGCITSCVWSKAHTTHLHSWRIVVSGSGHIENKINYLNLSAICINIEHSKMVLSRMQPMFHATRLIPHGASRLVRALSAWSVKTRRAPSRRGSMVTRLSPYQVYESRYIPSPPPSPFPVGSMVVPLQLCTMSRATPPPHACAFRLSIPTA